MWAWSPILVLYILGSSALLRAEDLTASHVQRESLRSARPIDDSVRAPEQDPKTVEVIELMAPIIHDCIKRKDSQEYALFHGCYDWHSAVHGFWATFRMARYLGKDNEAVIDAEKALTPENILKEKENLLQNDWFENPYGRSWFLRLAIDFELWARSRGVDNSKRLRTIADVLAAKLLSELKEKALSPGTSEYQNHSWPLTQLAAYFKMTGDVDKLREVNDLVRKYFIAKHANEPTLKDDKNEFFSKYGNWLYLVTKSQSAEATQTFLNDHPINENDLKPITGETMHSYGVNWSRAWAFKSAASRLPEGDPKRAVLNDAFNRHIEFALSNHEKNANNYGYTHWIPQFAVYAMTEGLPDTVN